MRSTLLVCLGVLTFASAQSSRFVLSSPDIRGGATIPDEFVFDDFGCTGGNRSPALTWTGVPTGTKSLAVIVHDPDAVTGVGGFTHWMVYDIPPNTTALPRGAGSALGRGLPDGAKQTSSSFGTAVWSGPCPPRGDAPHRYVFTVYALRVDKLDLPANATQAFVGFAINGNAIAKTSFTATYGR